MKNTYPRMNLCGIKESLGILGAKDSRMLQLLVVWSLLLFSYADVSANEYSTCQVNGLFKPRYLKDSLIPQYLNCSVKQGKIASKITWKEQDQVLKQESGSIKWLGLSLDFRTPVGRVEDLRCEVMVENTKHSCGLAQEGPPRITATRQEYEAYVGTSLVIPCRATGSPQPEITWIKRAESLATQDMPQSIKQVRSRESLDLVFKKVSMKHSGIYTCHAVNRLGKDTYVVFVVPVYYTFLRRPRVVPLHHVITVPKGSTAVLVCSAKYTPWRYTALFWNHRGIRIKNTARYHMKSRYSERIVKKKYKDQRFDMELTISHVTSKDVGMYTCGVVTHVGSHENHVELRIKE